MQRVIMKLVVALACALGVVAAAAAQAAPSLTANPGTLAFGDRSLTAANAVLDVTFTNTGDADYAIASIGIPIGTFEGFQLATATMPRCTTTTVLGVGQSCNVRVLFAAQSVGPKQATLRITGAGDAVTRDVLLTANATAPELAVTPASPDALDAGNIPVDGESATLTATWRNIGSRSLTVSFVDAAGSVVDVLTGPEGGTCVTGLVLAPDATCTAKVVFRPTAEGATSSSLVLYMVDGTNLGVFVRGAGVRDREIEVPALQAFGDQRTSAGPTVRTFEVHSTGSLPLTPSFITVVSTVPNEFARATGPEAGTCTQNVAIPAGGSCTIGVRFDPSAIGPRTGRVEIRSNAANIVPFANGAATIQLTGEGTDPEPSILPSPATFDARALGSGPSPVRTLTVTNVGTTRLDLTGLTLTGDAAADFARAGGPDAGTCTATSMLAPAASCTYGVVFTPSATGTRSALLRMTSNAGTTDATLTGVGEPAAVPPAPPAEPEAPAPAPPAPAPPAPAVPDVTTPVTPAVVPPPAVVPVTTQAQPPTPMLLPVRKNCVSRRSFVLQVFRTKGRTPRSIEVRYAGKVIRRSGRTLRSRIDLRGLPKGSFTVRVVVRFTDGSVLRDSRVYRTCAPKRTTKRTR